MKKLDVYGKLLKEGVVAVVRGESAEQAELTADACSRGGIKILEITFTAPDADAVIKSLTRKYRGSDICVGAGSVLDPETAKVAIAAGADFVVSPAFNIETVKLCNRYGVPMMSGVMTPTELVAAMEAGVDIIKLFPGDIATPAGLKALKGPFPQANIMPTGGVNAQNVADWFKAGAVAVGAGSFITAGAKKGDYEAVERESEKLVDQVKEILGGRK